MSPTLTCVALALVGVDLGYRPASNGGAEFIIQINPATLQALAPKEPIGIDVPREAQGMRPSHFTITLGNEQLPHDVSVAAAIPPATLPTGPASPVVPAWATSTAGSQAVETARVAPPDGGIWQVGPRLGAFGSGTASVATRAPPALPAQAETGTMASTSAAPSGPRIDPLPPPNSDGHPWLLMCLLVIALSASTSYFFYLFWDSRQQYQRLLSSKFSFGPQAAEA